MISYNAPFFTTWFCSLGTVLFLPLYLLCQACCGSISPTSNSEPRSKTSGAGIRGTLQDSVQGMREKGFTPAKFLGRCCLFSALWILTNYLYVYSLKILGATEVAALFATNVSFIYLLSWVVLHEQFVGIRVRSLSRVYFQI